MTSYLQVLSTFLYLSTCYGQEYITSTGIDEAIVEYFSTQTKYLNIQIQLTENASQSWQDNIMMRLTHVLQMHETNLTFGIGLNTALPESQPIRHNLVYLDSYEALKPLLTHYDHHFCDTIGSYVIQLKMKTAPYNITNQLYKEEIRKIFKLMFEYNVVNVIVIMRNAEQQLVVYTYRPFQEKLCRSTEPVVVNSYNGTHFTNSDLFPHILRNFYHCKLRIFARNVAPFFMYNEENNKSSEYVGIEAQILKQIAWKLNFTVELYRDPQQYWGDITENGTMTGPYLLLQNNQVDMLLGYFSYAHLRVHYFSESDSYLLSPMVAMVRKLPGELTTSVNWFLEPFKGLTWMCLLLYVALTMSFIKFSAALSKHHCIFNRHPSCSWIDLFGFLLGLAQTVVPARSTLRFSVMMCCLGFTVFNSTYQAKLFDSYSHVKTFSSRSIAELNDKNYTFVLRSSFDLAIALEDLNVPKERIRFEFTNDPNRIYELVGNSNGHMATLASYLRIIFYIRSQHAYNTFDFLPEKVRLQQMCAYFRRHSYLLQPFNEIIGMLRQGGLINKWLVDLDFKLNILEHRSRFSKAIDYPKALDVVKFKYIFIGFICMNLLAFGVLVLEIYVHARSQKKVREQKNKLKILTGKKHP